MNVSEKKMAALSSTELQSVAGGLSIIKCPFPFIPCPYPFPDDPSTDPVDLTEIVPYFTK